MKKELVIYAIKIEIINVLKEFILIWIIQHYTKKSQINLNLKKIIFILMNQKQLIIVLNQEDYLWNTI